MPTYLAVIHKNKDSEYGVSFPDFPGFRVTAPTVPAAILSARDALQFHIAGMVEDIPLGYPPNVIMATDIDIDIPLPKPDPEAELRKERDRLKETAGGVPRWITGCIIEHIVDGVRPSNSLIHSILQNNLHGAMAASEGVSRIELLCAARWQFNEAPQMSWGSRERVEAWQAHNGLRGQKEKS